MLYNDSDRVTEKGTAMDFDIEKETLIESSELFPNQKMIIESEIADEIYKYGLTPREAEVWLLYRTNYSYKEIADELCITLNVVKRHMKNILAKRSSFYNKEDSFID